MKIIQIAVSTEHYKNGELYTDIYGLGDDGELYIRDKLGWNILSPELAEGKRGQELSPLKSHKEVLPL